MRDEHGPPVPELARRMTACSCPPRPGPRPGPGAHRDAHRRHRTRRHPVRLRLRAPRRRGLGPSRCAAPGRSFVQDLHPLRPRAPRHPPRRRHRQREPVLPGHAQAAAGTHAACPQRDPREQTAEHDTQAAELARHKLGKITADDADGYHRVMCPAAMGKIRCPLRPPLHDPGPRPAGDPRPARAPPGLLAPSRPSPSPPTSPPRPARSTTTRPGNTASPTPGAQAPSGPSPPPRTRPATTSPAAGPGSRA